MNLLTLVFFSLMVALAAPVDNIGGGSTIGHATPDLYRRRGELTPPPGLIELEELKEALYSEYRNENDALKKIKYYLVNGETRLASVLLSKLAFKNGRLRPIVFRYIGILAFIEGDYRKSFSYLDRPELKESPHFAKICTLKVLNQVILNITHDLGQQWSECRTQGHRHFAATNLWWLETLIELKLHPKAGVTRIPFKGVRLDGLSSAELKIFLKLAIYLNQEKEVLAGLPQLSVDQLQDTEVRELVGQIFFRTGSLALAYRYVEDLRSPNAESIKGNLYVLRSKYELAYAQFKLALEQKQNSQNAMERLLPLAWLLGDWEAGGKYAEQAIASPDKAVNKMTLAAAFQVQKGAFAEAAKILETVAQKSRRGTELDVTQLHSFSSLMQNRPLETQKYASMSCAQYDLTNCWLLLQLAQWDAFPVMIRRDEKIAHRREWEKLTKEDLNDPLKEIVYVNQLDIEELDDKLIQLVPGRLRP